MSAPWVFIRSIGRDHVAQGLRHLAALGIHDEAVGEHRVVGRPAARAAALQQRGMEPAAMLVGALEIERGRPLQLGPPLQHGGVGAAALEPDVEDVVDLLVVVGGVGVAQELLRVAGPPGVGTLRLEGAGDALDHLGVAQDLARGLVDEHRDRHAPGALARDAPVRAGSRSSSAAGSCRGRARSGSRRSRPGPCRADGPRHPSG